MNEWEQNIKHYIWTLQNITYKEIKINLFDDEKDKCANYLTYF